MCEYHFFRKREWGEGVDAGGSKMYMELVRRSLWSSTGYMGMCIKRIENCIDYSQRWHRKESFELLADRILLVCMYNSWGNGKTISLFPYLIAATFPSNRQNNLICTTLEPLHCHSKSSTSFCQRQYKHLIIFNPPCSVISIRYIPSYTLIFYSFK